MTLTCSCPTRDGVACLQMRYGLNLDEALLSPCGCSCHLKENQSDPIYEWEEDEAYYRTDPYEESDYINW